MLSVNALKGALSLEAITEECDELLKKKLGCLKKSKSGTLKRRHTNAYDECESILGASGSDCKQRTGDVHNQHSKGEIRFINVVTTSSRHAPNWKEINRLTKLHMTLLTTLNGA